jgi:hypothetical protein
MQPPRMKGRAAVVDAALRRKRKQHVLIDHGGILRGHGFVASLRVGYLPRRRSEETLARDQGEGLLETGIGCNAGSHQHLLGIGPSDNGHLVLAESGIRHRSLSSLGQSSASRATMATLLQRRKNHSMISAHRRTVRRHEA